MDIGWAIIGYAQAHGDAYPDSIDILFEKGFLKPPLDARSLLTGRPYIYLASGEKASAKSSAASRFVLLYDPDGQRGWVGPLRVIVYIRADLEPEIAADPMLGEVAWSWLTEALDARTSGYAAPSGTVTRVVTEGFGAKREDPQATGFELRASWSPVGMADLPADPVGQAEPDSAESAQAGLDGHLAAWCGAICAAAGLPPLVAGVTALRPPARRRGS